MFDPPRSGGVRVTGDDAAARAAFDAHSASLWREQPDARMTWDEITDRAKEAWVLAALAARTTPGAGITPADEPTDDDLTAMLDTLVPGATMPHVRDVIRRLLRGERIPQCEATWPPNPEPCDGYAACQLRRGHRTLHARPDGARWGDGAQLLATSPSDEDADEQAGFWLSDQMCDSDPEHAEMATRVKGMLRAEPAPRAAAPDGDEQPPTCWTRLVWRGVGGAIVRGPWEPLASARNITHREGDGGEPERQQHADTVWLERHPTHPPGEADRG